MFAKNKKSSMPKQLVSFVDLFVSPTYVAPPSDWLGAIKLVLSKADNPEFRYMDALLMRLLDGDAVAVLMVRHLLAWLPHSIRPDGAIWRPAEEWGAYCGISESQVYNSARRKRLESLGFTIWSRKAMGQKQLHFKLDSRYFTARIANVLGIEGRLLHEWVWVKAESADKKVSSADSKASSLNEEVSSLNGKDSLTDNTTQKTTETKTETKDLGALVSSLVLLQDVDSIFEGLVSGGLMTGVDRVALKNLSRDAVVDCLSSLELAKKVRNPRAYLRKALMSKKSEADKLALMLTPSTEKDEGEVVESAGGVPSWMVEADVEDDAPSWWRAAIAQIESRFNPSWWAYAQRLEFGSLDGDVVSLKRPDNVAERIYLQFARNIQQILRDCLGRVVSVRYIV